MKIKKDDNVIVISGKDKGKTGKVLRALPSVSRIVVAGVNVRKIHKRPSRSNQKGQIIDQAGPIHVSNVMILDAKENKRSRVGYEKKDGKKIRISKKSGQTLSS
jgi:large subunit ribosomal protein L24